jgi:retron-type reverse transcriptase
MNIDAYASEIRKMLINGEFHTSEYKIHTIYEPKKRDIYVLPFYPDRIVHHCVMNILEPIFDSWFINDSYCCRTGKGSIAASDKCSKYVNNFKFCVQYDIKHYFPSINHDILINIIERKIKDNKLLDLLSDIIYSIDGPTNLPIGNHTSQWFGNLYLNELDQFVMHNLDKRFHFIIIKDCDILNQLH